ncbi:MAG: C-GCAxxG-C-C family protein [Desulfobacterales bacterium]|nr:C-GCAxxG-C-C family protein [Desulfobacterales bacterium]
MSQEYNIENEIIPHIAMCFGGGIGLTGAVCGAVSGAVMAIGLIKGPAANVNEFQQTMPLASALRRRFEAEMTTISCRELTGVDLTIPGNFETYMASDTPQKVCVPAVDTAYRLAMEILKDTK